MTRRLLSLAAAAAALTAAHTAHATPYTVCVRFDIETADSAASTDSLREDYFLDADEGRSVPAYGVYINLYRNGQSITGGNVITDPSTGCYTYNGTLSGPVTMRVYARARDSHDNYVRIHNGGVDDLSSYPGQTYSILTDEFSLAPFVHNNIDVGSGSARWTMMASAAFTLLRFNAGNYDTAIHIAEDRTFDCFNSSSWNNSSDDNSNDWVDDGRAYIRIKQRRHIGCSAEGRNYKFLIAHEMGHALLRMHAGAVEGPQADDFPYSALVSNPVADCISNGDDGPDDSYHLNSVEWGSRALKEGFADFVSAKVFNNRAATGRFIRFGQEIDLEYAPIHAPGGRLVNTCLIPSSNGWGLGIRSDWLRFLWDWYSSNVCSPTPTRVDVMDIFSTMMNAHQDGTRPYTDSTAYGAALDAMYAQGFSSCLEADFREDACWNGVDRQSGFANNGCY